MHIKEYYLEITGTIYISCHPRLHASNLQMTALPLDGDIAHSSGQILWPVINFFICSCCRKESLRWQAVGNPQCKGMWRRVGRLEACSCPTAHSFLFIWHPFISAILPLTYSLRYVHKKQSADTNTSAQTCSVINNAYLCFRVYIISHFIQQWRKKTIRFL